VIAAKRSVTELIAEGRMDVFLDLHNPAPADPRSSSSCRPISCTSR
jgi:hypothetical protein